MVTLGVRPTFTKGICMFKKLGMTLVLLNLSACGLELDRGTNEIPNMTGTWLSEHTITYTSKTDGRLLKTTTKKINTYIEDTENGIRSATCLQIWDGSADSSSEYSGTKTKNEYFPLGETAPTNPYLFNHGVLVQTLEIDAIWEGLDVIKSVRKVLTFVDSKNTIYTDGEIQLTGSFDYSASTEICSQQVNQKLPERNESTTFIFTFPGDNLGENGDQGGMDIFFSFVGKPVSGLYDFDTSDVEVGFQGVFMLAYTKENADTFDNADRDWFDEAGWIDLISADNKRFEGNFSIDRKDQSVTTGYISADVSGLQ